jgi:hypothetical protein
MKADHLTRSEYFSALFEIGLWKVYPLLKRRS